MIKIGQKVHIRRGDEFEEGIVKYVHQPHQWFSVEHGTDEYKWRTSFKFDEIGKTVRVMKG